MVTAWFQRQIRIRIARFFTGLTQGMDLGVGPTRPLVPAAADDNSFRYLLMPVRL